MNHVIELRGLTKFYGRQRGIEDVSFTVEEGEIFGFIGPNGAGKSTTIRTLLALVRPTAGSASIFGLDCVTQATRIAAQVGYLPAECGYYEELRVGQLLRYAAALYKKNCGDRAEELCRRLELDPGRKIGDLSLGNRKKVGIVQGLLHSPRLIVLDEPTSGLDPLMQRVFFDLLREENARGATIFFSSHILSEVQRLCGRVAILRDGRLEGVHTVAQLRENGCKRVSLVWGDRPQPEALDRPGITQLESDASGARFLYRGEVSRLLPWLAGLEPGDVTVEEPDLDEVFLRYYR